jgi:hypothetical protein
MDPCASIMWPEESTSMPSGMPPLVAEAARAGDADIWAVGMGLARAPPSGAPPPPPPPVMV